VKYKFIFLTLKIVSILKLKSKEYDMKQNNTLGVILLGLVSLGHLIRVIFSFDIIIGTTLIPIYVSVIAFLLFGFAAYSVCPKKK